MRYDLQEGLAANVGRLAVSITPRHDSLSSEVP